MRSCGYSHRKPTGTAPALDPTDARALRIAITVADLVVNCRTAEVVSCQLNWLLRSWAESLEPDHDGLGDAYARGRRA